MRSVGRKAAAVAATGALLGALAACGSSGSGDAKAGGAKPSAAATGQTAGASAGATPPAAGAGPTP
ncbi:PRC and DUF2382 domain-containing protein, partial [Kitasatospora sp. NPDC004240]